MANFFTADTHYGHVNIASKNGSQWKSGWRGFKDVDDMNNHLVKQINLTVGPDDTLYHIGDWSFGGIDNIWKFRSQIVCNNIHLILGNHDHHIEGNKILPGIATNAQDMFSSVSHYKEISIGNNIYVLSHYPMAVWHGNGKNWRHLHGHCHGSFKSIGLSMDVGVDVAAYMTGDYRPFSEDEIEDCMHLKTPKLLDHHGPSTNTGKHPKGR